MALTTFAGIRAGLTTTGRRATAALAGAALAATALSALAAPARAESAAPGHLLIIQVNGDQSGVYRTNWVELYNPTDSAVALGSIDGGTVTPNYYLCYASQSGSSCTNPYQLYGTVLAHHHFLIELYDSGDTTYPAWPAGVSPDLNFGSTDPTVNPSQQAAKNIGGYATGGQLLLLDAAVDKTGAYPTKANYPASAYSSTNRNLADASINPSPVVDAVGFTPPAKAASLAGSEGWTSPSDAHSAPVQDASHWDDRVVTDGVPQDTGDNAADFRNSQRDPISQVSSRVAVAPVDDATISREEAMPPISVTGSKGVGTLSYSAAGLPDGVTIDAASGVVSGTPAADDRLGAYRVTATVADRTPGTPDTASTSFTLTLSSTLRVDPIDDVTARKGEPLDAVRVQAHGGTPGYTYAATGLPDGVTVDADGGIGGTPTGTVGSYRVHVTVTDSGTGTGDDARQQATTDFTLTEQPARPGADDPLAGVRLNEVKATGTPAKDWVELYNTGGDITDASVDLRNAAGATYHLTGLELASHGYAVVEGADLHAAGLDLAAGDTLSLLEPGGQTQLDSATWTAFQPTSWARTTDGTGDFAASAYPTKGSANSGPPAIEPNDLVVTEVNYDNNSTDYYEYSEVTNTTDHPIDFDAYGLTLTKSGVAMTLHDPSDTSSGSPTTDPVIPAHGTQLFWWVENQYLGVKTTANFLANYGLPADTSVVLVFGFSSLANSGGDHSYYLSVNHGSTPVSRAYVDTPCAANTLNGSSVCTATNRNYAEHFKVPAERSDPTAAVWYNSLHAGGDDINYVLTAPLSTPGTVDLEQPGFTRAVTIGSAAGDTITLHNSAKTAVDLSGYVLLKNYAGARYTLPAGTTVAAGDDLAIDASTSGLSFAGRDYLTLLAPAGYDYTDGIGLADTTGPLLHTLAYDASSGQPPQIDPTTGLPLPPAGGLYRPAGVSARAGTVYASNTGDNLLAALAGGANTVVAGSLDRYGFETSQDGGKAADASLYQPGGSAVDASGNVYLADSGDNVVLEITKADGTIHLVAGTGTAGGAGAAISATSTGRTVNLNHPESVALDPAGNLYIADTYDNRIVKVTPAGAATRFAGSGKAGYTGDGGAASDARLSQPAGIATDSVGNVYVADSANNVVRRIDAGGGVITTVAGDYAADQASNDCLGGFDGDGGPATSAQLNDPQGVAVDGAGDLFVADTFNNAVREVTPDGTIDTVVNNTAAVGSENTSPTGSGARPATTHLNTPYAVGLDGTSHALYVADTRNSVIAEVVHLAEDGSAAGPAEPADQVAVTGSGKAYAACSALVDPPEISAVSPAEGPRTGGSTVTLTGEHFTGATTVRFGSEPGTDVHVVDDQHLTVTTPAHDVGRVDVTVTNPAGTSTVTAGDGFTYQPLLPVVTGVSPTSGPVGGKTSVTLAGSNFTGATSVSFGTVAGTDVHVVDDEHLTVTSPAHAAGAVDVTVTGAEGTSATSAADAFTYEAPAPVVPVVTALAPSSGLILGGTTVTVTGSRLAGATGVRFGATAATRVTVLDDTHLRVTSPAHAAGRVDVTVTTPGGRSGIVAADRFTYTTPPCTYLADYARLARAELALAADRKARTSAEGALHKTRSSKHRAKLRHYIRTLDKRIAAETKTVVVAQQVLTADSHHGWCRNQVAARARLTHAEATLAKDRKALSSARHALTTTHDPKHKARLRTWIAVLTKRVAADERAVAAAEKALKSTR